MEMCPWIIREGGKAFAAMGTDKSKGTKVFALAGKVKHGGLVEVPMGMTIREIILISAAELRTIGRLKASKWEVPPVDVSQKTFWIRRWITRALPKPVPLWGPAV